MNRLFDILYSLAEKIITIIFSIIILYLLILAGFSTTNVELHTEHVLLASTIDDNAVSGNIYQEFVPVIYYSMY